ncbi:hypothetical protein JNM87_06155, partial [Candidatus Saccharibacteria bacterium]|nr:hypothetical protein [Candidatus Saccharibacteria bacterium]
AASYAAAGDKKAAAMAIACVAAAAVPGAVAAIKVAKAAKEVKNLRTATALGMMRNVDRAIIANNAAQLSRNANRGTVLLRSQNGGIGVHLTGKAHAGMPTPHTHIYRANIAPSGRVSMNKTKQFRLTSYNDLRLVRKYLRKGR